MTTISPRTASLWGLALIALGALPLYSQNATPTNSKQGQESLRVSLLPIGDPPISGAIIVNERPVMVDPEPSELVPETIFVKEEKKYKSLNLMMNSPSANWERPRGSSIKVMIKKDGDYSEYLTVKLPEQPEDVTVFMLRNKESKSWQDTPHTVTLKNGIESFPLGSLRLINFSSVPVKATILKKDYLLKPNSMKVITEPGSNAYDVIFTYQLLASINGKATRLVRTAIKYNKKSRLNLVVYDRDGTSEIKLEGSTNPVKTVKYFELPYKPRAATRAK